MPVCYGCISSAPQPCSWAVGSRSSTNSPPGMGNSRVLVPWAVLTVGCPPSVREAWKHGPRLGGALGIRSDALASRCGRHQDRRGRGYCVPERCHSRKCLQLSFRRSLYSGSAQYETQNFYGDNMLGTEGAEWRRHRKVAKPVFNEVCSCLVPDFFLLF
jgi:hypothetical protein